MTGPLDSERVEPVVVGEQPTATGELPQVQTPPPHGLAVVLVVVGVAVFMAQLDNLVVTTALPQIGRSLHQDIGDLEWVVNAYTLGFAVLLMFGAAMGELFGRRRVFVAGLALFTLASAAAGASQTGGELVAARAVQGIGGALVVPLTVTLLSAAVAPDKRGAALGVWGALAGLAVALGPLLGGMVVQWASWEYVFWINVPVGILLIPLAIWGLRESRGPQQRLDVVGTTLVSLGLFGVVFGLVRGGTASWTSAGVLSSLIGGGLLGVAFVVWELRTDHPMLPMRLFRNRGFSLTNLASFLMSFGMFGSIFLLTQFLQNILGYSALTAGVRELPWTGVPIVVAPLAGMLADRIGSRWIIAFGLAAMAVGLGLVAAAVEAGMPYRDLVPGFVVSGFGMALFFAPVAAQVLDSVARTDEGVASGANNALRELGGVFGISLLTAVFVNQGGTSSPGEFLDGLRPAMWVGAVVVLVAAVAAALVPARRARAGSAGGSPTTDADTRSAADPVVRPAADPVAVRSTAPDSRPARA